MRTSKSADLPLFRLRPALASDFPAIRKLIYSENLNPIGLNWSRFLLAVDRQERILGCGQIKPHSDGSLELASIAVVPECRRAGIGSAIVHALQAQAAAPLYLTCAADLEAYYSRFGFFVASPKDQPPYFRRIGCLVSMLSHLRLLPPDSLRIMVYYPVGC